jgi:hypothetical protein
VNHLQSMVGQAESDEQLEEQKERHVQKYWTLGWL